MAVIQNNEFIHESDFLVIGSGLAGLAFALKVASIEETKKIIIVSKDQLASANTSWAQGGIAAVMSKEDSFASHISDTLHAGAGLCIPEVVQNYIEQAPERIQDLISWGVQFDVQAESGKVDLTREGGHSHRRILHFEDHTGGEIHRALLHKCLQQPKIQFLQSHFAIDLILQQANTNPGQRPPCQGAYVLNKSSGQVEIFLAKSTILATGGAGKVYLYTSNWSGATGDGIAMAYRAGAHIANLEFMQFHPTCLYHKDARNFLISEALRGEGGELINSQGEAFMKKFHRMGSLAPRDIVARGIDAEMKRTGEHCVYLDMRKQSREYLQNRFPVIYQKCLEFGIEMSTHPIPVVPAAHYLCGGVLSDVNGRTNIENLWVLGETACTGLHGANRLASNSLLECLAMAHNAAHVLIKNFPDLQMPNEKPNPWQYPPETNADELIVVTHMWEEVRTLMWNYVGIVRSNKRLERASHRLQNILAEVKEYYSQNRIHSDILELRNIAIVADLTVQCALLRKESRGIHYNLDYAWAKNPAQSETERIAEDTVLKL